MTKQWGIGIMVGVLLAAAIVVGFQDRRSSVVENGKNQKLSVVASFYPLAYFAEAIGGEDVEVSTLTPAGAEPHEYEPTPGDIVKLEKSKVVIVNGAGFEPWLAKLKSELEGRGIEVIEAGQESATQQDPHVWLSPVLAQREVESILTGFSKADPTHSTQYQQRALELKKSLGALDEQYTLGLLQCQTQDFITSHNAFGYLAKQYKLNQISIAGLSPEAEPSAKDLARIAELARRSQTHYIFFETLVSPKLAQTLAASVGAQTLELNPLEGLTVEQRAHGEDYLSVMKTNLTHLRLALGCR